MTLQKSQFVLFSELSRSEIPAGIKVASTGKQ